MTDDRIQSLTNGHFRSINSQSIAENLAISLTIHNFCIRISKNRKITSSIVSQLKYTAIEE